MLLLHCHNTKTRFLINFKQYSISWTTIFSQALSQTPGLFCYEVLQENVGENGFHCSKPRGYSHMTDFAATSQIIWVKSSSFVLN